MVKTDSSYNRIDFAKLESKVETMSEKLNKLDEIEKTLQEIQKCLNTNHTDVIVLGKDMDSIGEKHRMLEDKFNYHERNDEIKFKEIDTRLDKLTIKITTIATIISTIAWIVSSILMKFI